jgi:putative transposase
VREDPLLPRPVPTVDLALMRQIDRLHMEFPFAGFRMLRLLLAGNGSKIGRRHAKTLTSRMGIVTLYRRPRTTKPLPGHTIDPYLLRGLEITRSNRCGRWTSRTSRWRAGLSTSRSCSAGSRAGPVVVRVDHDGGIVLRRGTRGSTGASRQAGDLQHGSGLGVHVPSLTGVRTTHAIRISMDGKGAWRDNVLVERLWRTIKYEEVYDSVSDARQSIGRYLDLYNRRCPHSSLDGRTPDQAYFEHDPMLPIRLAA